MNPDIDRLMEEMEHNWTWRDPWLGRLIGGILISRKQKEDLFRGM